MPTELVRLRAYARAGGRLPGRLRRVAGPTVDVALLAQADGVRRRRGAGNRGTYRPPSPRVSSPISSSSLSARRASPVFTSPPGEPVRGVPSRPDPARASAPAWTRVRVLAGVAAAPVAARCRLDTAARARPALDAPDLRRPSAGVRPAHRARSRRPGSRPRYRPSAHPIRVAASSAAVPQPRPRRSAGRVRLRSARSRDVPSAVRGIATAALDSAQPVRVKRRNSRVSLAGRRCPASRRGTDRRSLPRARIAPACAAIAIPLDQARRHGHPAGQPVRARRSCWRSPCRSRLAALLPRIRHHRRRGERREPVLPPVMFSMRGAAGPFKARG